MRITALRLSQLAAGLALGLAMATSAPAATPLDDLSATVTRVEARLGARVGLVLHDTGSTLSWSHRADERFLMNSTVKVPVCGAILARRDAGALSLEDRLPVRAGDLVSYAPVTETRVGARMTLDALCRAAIDMSDNTAANLLIDHLGGPQEVTAFFRATGDEISRLDRMEPALNTFAPGDPRDTTTPAAMAGTLEALLFGDLLSSASQAQLAAWMRDGGVTGQLLRADTPDGWEVLDKSGAGSHTRNLIAVVTPPGRAPVILALFLSDGEAPFDARNAALQDIGRAVLAVIAD